jgi:hypothetical protein
MNVIALKFPSILSPIKNKQIAIRNRVVPVLLVEYRVIPELKYELVQLTRYLTSSLITLKTGFSKSQRQVCNGSFEILQ